MLGRVDGFEEIHSFLQNSRFFRRESMAKKPAPETGEERARPAHPIFRKTGPTQPAILTDSMTRRADRTAMQNLPRRCRETDAGMLLFAGVSGGTRPR
jgi:hypothetical protein